MRRQPPEPPALALLVLRRILPSDVRGESILGDAVDEWRERSRSIGPRQASRWLWRHTVGLTLSYGLRGRRRARPSRPGTARISFGPELRAAVRSLLKGPGASIVSLVVMGLGIGLCVFMFSIAHGVFFRGLGVPDAEEIWAVTRFDATLPGDFDPQWSFRDYLELSAAQESLREVVAYRTTQAIVGSGLESHPIGLARVTANLFRTLRVTPVAGRDFAPSDAGPGAPSVALISHRLWMERFRGRDEALGTTMRIDGVPAVLVGVMPPGFHFPEDQDLWAPTLADPVGAPRTRGGPFVVLGRGRQATRQAIDAELGALIEALQGDFPDTYRNTTVRAQTFIETQTGAGFTEMFVAMVVAGVFVLTIAVSNVGSLLLTRAAARTRPFATRVALGGGILRAGAPFFFEATLLSVGGSLIGLGIGWLSVDAFDRATAMALTGRPYYMRFEVGLEAWVFASTLALGCALMTGLAPVLQLRRLNTAALLLDGSRGASSLGIGRLTRVLVTVEVALSCALLVGAGLTAKSILALSAYDYPFRTERLVAGEIELRGPRYASADNRAGVLRRLSGPVNSRLPSGLTTALPATFAELVPMALDDDAVYDERDVPRVHRAVVDTGFFDVLEAAPVEGRLFDSTDADSGQHVAVVNEMLVRTWFAGRSPVGRRIRLGEAAADFWVTIVGVVPDLAMAGFVPTALSEANGSGIYLPISQHRPERVTMLMRVPVGVSDATELVRTRLQDLDPALTLHDVRTFDEVVRRYSWFYRVFGSVFLIFGIVAAFIASTGLYGVLSFAVASRTREIGIRVAFGAEHSNVLGLVLRQSGRQILLGLGLGLALAWMASRVVVAVVFDVHPRDPAVFLTVIVTIVLVGLAATIAPARRALRIDPLEALRAL